MSEHWTGQIVTHILNRHRLRGIQTHREAGSVDIEVVEKEQARVKELLARFQPQDRWNVDESTFYVFILCILSTRTWSCTEANEGEASVQTVPSR